MPLNSQSQPFAQPESADLALCQDRLNTVLGRPADADDIAVVGQQLGRYPRGMVAVAARCVCGAPLAVITRPLVEGRIPFPTTCYLTSPEAVKALSHLEAEGWMTQASQQLEQDAQVQAAYQRAHALYLAFRHELAKRLGDSEEHILGVSAGGMPVRVKCLHALAAQSLVMGEGVNPIGDQALRAAQAEFDPQVCRCARPGRVLGQGEETQTEPTAEAEQ